MYTLLVFVVMFYQNKIDRRLFPNTTQADDFVHIHSLGISNGEKKRNSILAKMQNNLVIISYKCTIEIINTLVVHILKILLLFNKLTQSLILSSAVIKFKSMHHSRHFLLK